MSKKNYAPFYSLEIRDLCLLKLSSKMLQNLQYLYNEKTQKGQSFFLFRATLEFFIVPNPLFTCPKLLEMKNEKKYNISGFSYYKKIANFKALNRTISSSINLLFLGSVKWHKKYFFLLIIFIIIPIKLALITKRSWVVLSNILFLFPTLIFC